MNFDLYLLFGGIVIIISFVGIISTAKKLYENLKQEDKRSKKLILISSTFVVLIYIIIKYIKNLMIK
ncbi:hypothetical protein [Terrisporobacter glycolicus]|uniref:hypothetical protein n=1 Tax=Terrisporobacter glycolicus TaxID=36841 RepID=UPI000CDEA066